MKKIVYLLILIILIIAVGASAFFLKNLNKPVLAPVLKVTENNSCSTLGQPTKVINQGPPTSDLSSCCSGLTPTYPLQDFDNACTNTYLEEGVTGPTNYLCLACGDGTCDTKYENKCNCPEDCGTNCHKTGEVFSTMPLPTGGQDTRPCCGSLKRIDGIDVAVCANCGKTASVPFRPSGAKPVYCSDCFESRR